MTHDENKLDKRDAPIATKPGMVLKTPIAPPEFVIDPGIVLDGDWPNTMFPMVEPIKKMVLLMHNDIRRAYRRLSQRAKLKPTQSHVD
jgi:hypothetical protein